MVRGRRFLLSILLLPLAFWLLGLSDPGVTYLSRGKAWWTSDSRFALHAAPYEAEIAVRDPRWHPRLRARFSRCPYDLEGCERGEYVTLRLPESGSLKLRFPGGQGPHPAPPVVFEVFREPFHPFYLAFLACLLASALLAFTGVDRWVGAWVLLTTGPVLAVSAGLNRALDLHGHLDHIELIRKVGTFVPSAACWECFQPPPYYLAASLFLFSPEKILPGGVLELQGVALLLHVLSVPLVTRALAPWCRGRRRLFLWSAFACLWPAVVLQGFRVGNDAPVAFASLAAQALAVAGWPVAAAGAAALAVLVKNSGVVVAAALAAWLGWRAFRGQVPRRTLALCATILVAALGADQAVKLAKKSSTHTFARMSEKLATRDSPAELLLPNLAALVVEPFVNPWVPDQNRAHALNYLFKSSLTGEWSYSFRGASFLARLLAVLLLGLLACALAALFRRPPPGDASRLLPALCLGFGVVAVLAYRAIFHYANHADFRFIAAPATFGLAALLASAGGSLTGRIAARLAVAFLAVSQVFFALLWLSELV